MAKQSAKGKGAAARRAPPPDARPPVVAQTTSSTGGAPLWGPRAGTARDFKPRTLAGQTAQRLREDIIRNRFQPGERLTIEKLTASYQVGTSPLREALFQVAGDGLVRVEDHKGFVVAPLNVGEMLDVSSLRAYLEINAIRRSIENGGEDWETGVLSAEHRLTRAEARLVAASGDEVTLAEDEWEKRHREFHYALCSACGSPWLLHFFDALYDQLERYRRHLWRYKDRARDADDQHEQIKHAALARDAERAVALLTEHFKRQAELTIAPATDVRTRIVVSSASNADAAGREATPPPDGRQVRPIKRASSTRAAPGKN
jgi:GntR family transcriptional regulator, carbon starvation induced regulator